MLELRPHNYKAVKEIQHKLTEGYKKIIYVAGTGCGKSYVFIGVVDSIAEVLPDFKLSVLKVLYVLPKHVIKENLEGYEDYRNLACEIDFCTFNYFSTIEKGESKLAQYDLIVIDECHHLGASRYGKNLVSCMNKLDKLFLGLTATPFRDSDKIDVTDYFESRVDGLSVWEAIRQGLMPMFNYHLCLPEKDTKQLEQEYNNEVQAKIDYMDSTDVVKDVVLKYHRDKWICFFNSKAGVERMLPVIEDIFQGYKIFILLASLRNLRSVMKGVQKAKKAVILSVNILLEGVHLSGITGIILYRNVCSTSVFQQMLGRTTSIGNTVEPVVIDTSQSASKILSKLLAENKSHSNATSSPCGVSNKEIMRVGIGSTIEYNLETLLKVCDSRSKKQQAMLELVRKAVAQYEKLNGNTSYETFTELKRSGLDYKKFKACAELYNLQPLTVFNWWKDSEVQYGR